MEKQEVSKRIQVYLPAELASQVEQLAKAEHMTLSSCCTTIIGDAVQEMNEDSPSAVDPTDDGPDEAVHIHLYRKEAALLKKKADELQITPTQWVRHTVLHKDLNIYHIKLDDLEELVDLLGRNTEAIEGIVAVCREDHSVSKQDIELIKELMETIRTQFITQFYMTLNKRDKEKERRIKKSLE